VAEDTSPGGSKIYRHTERLSPLADGGGDPDLFASILAHMTAQVGKPARVLPERSSDPLPIEIHIIPPSDEPVFTLFTVGMSQHEMTLPNAVDLPRRAELILRLPKTWSIDDDVLAQPGTAWPILWLKALARMPHRYDTWLAPTHTVPNGDPPRPFCDGTGLCCMLTVPPICVAEDADVIESPRGKVLLMSVMAIHESEMRFKLEHGADALIERLAAAGIDDVVDPQRAAVC
jgi:Suppressor of fused protein (SUFU)